MNLTPIQQLEAAIRECPSNPELYLQLAPLYLDKDRDYEAEKMLLRGQTATGDPRVRQLREDVTMQRLARSLVLAEQHVAADDTPESRAVLAQVIAERDRVEMEIFVSRRERDPGNAAVSYELGLRLKRAGKLQEACRPLEEALDDPAHRPAAALELGECLRHFNQVPDALKYYRLAAESATEPGQIEHKKQALWQAVGLATRIKLFKLAERYMNDLARIDPLAAGRIGNSSLRTAAGS
jgi:tetratricopeptide (TPR) repeat protein